MTKKFLFLLLFFISIPGIFETVEAKPAPGLAGALSIIPGLGQVANGDTLDGLAYFTTSVGLFIGFKRGIGHEAGFKLWMYNMYDAYRDAGASGAAKQNVFQNYIANYNPLNIIDPIGASILAVGALSNGKSKLKNTIPSQKVGRAIFFTFTGLGEEALFRGFLFPGFSNLLSSKWAGAAVSSVLFGLAHGEGGTALITRTIMGMLFCWQVDLNKYDLRKNIFAHSWFDFLVTRNGNYAGSINIDIVF